MIRAGSKLVAGAIFLLSCARLAADTVVLKDGSSVTGTIVIEMSQKIVIKTDSGNRVISTDDIVSVSKSTRAEAPRSYPDAVAQPRSRPAAPAPAQGTPASLDDPVANAVVKVYTTYTRPDPAKPWARLPAEENLGSGVVIDGNRILTSAHLIYYASQIYVKPNGAGDKISAKVDAFDQGLDLAILKLDDESFFATHAPLPHSEDLPRSRDVVAMYGYPWDSTNVEVVRASVTEVDYGPYAVPDSGYRIRTNQEFVHGISGAPCMLNDRMIGLACRHPNAITHSSFSFVVPYRELLPFLSGAGNHTYRGKPAVFDETQHLENPALREYLRIDPSQHGIVVSRPGSNPGNTVMSMDVITSTLGQPIDDIGTVEAGTSGRMSYASAMPANDSFVRYSVVRGGGTQDLRVPTVTNRQMLLPSRDGVYPSYFILGPIVFSAASTQVDELIASSPQLESILTYRGSPLVTRRTETPAFDGEELVYIPSPFFPNKLAAGYGDPTLTTVKSVNGTRIKNLLHLVTLLRDSTDEFITIEFYERDSEILVFPRKAMIDATEDILNDNGVRNQGSSDTMGVWKPGS